MLMCAVRGVRCVTQCNLRKHVERGFELHVYGTLHVLSRLTCTDSHFN